MNSLTNQSEPPHVLLLFDSLGTGGAQEFAWQLCHALRETVLFSVATFGGTEVYTRRFRELGLAVYPLAPDDTKISLALGNARPLTNALCRLKRLLDSNRFDLLHTFLQVSFAFGTPLAWSSRTPTIHTIVASRLQTQFWYYPLMRLFQPGVRQYITYAPADLEKCGIARARYKAVELAGDFSAALSNVHSPTQAIPPYDLCDAFPVLLSIGRLHPDKGHIYAIRALPLVLREFPRARLLIVGDGAEENRLRDETRMLALEENVIFTGYRNDLDALLRRADIGLRMSVNEGVNFTTIQMLAAALPVVGFENPAPKPLLQHDINGLLVPLGDVDALAKRIVELAHAPELGRCLGQAGRLGVQNHYDSATIYAFYAKLYRTLRAGKSLADLDDQSAAIANFNERLRVSDKVN